MDEKTALKYRSKTDLVTSHLRQAIQKGKIKPGQRLVVDRVASELGVSKVPVREAVTRLTGEGLLELRPNIGPVVPAFTADDVTETALLRVAVETVALRLAVPLHDQETLRRAEALLDQMSSEDEAFPELNVRFHASLVATAPYPYMRNIIDTLLLRAQRFSTVNRVPGYRHEAQREHRQLLQAVAAKDVPTVVRLNEEHVCGAAEQLVTYLRTADENNQSC